MPKQEQQKHKLGKIDIGTIWIDDVVLMETIQETHQWVSSSKKPRNPPVGFQVKKAGNRPYAKQVVDFRSKSQKPTDRFPRKKVETQHFSDKRRVFQ